ncbi:uncharacterized protein N7506_003094 [Penicillium brevicompactum]|uniref:uncharacterized protein n=1 Tax=Penicillium brevicompactum TaxID=5074 RepID=UPI0025417270|nr:uncharacterized protein N7506_003094 [Penicillium brevicompactum]KAJ5343270.1 hypothetical protein N7506_003094 [Penicillium brevicompactum]
MAVTKVLSLIPASGLLAVGTFFYTTRQIEAIELSPEDPIFKSKHHQKYNPNNNPTVNDLHIRKVPFSQIDPAYLENPERLIERFSGGVWAGSAFAIQRTLGSDRQPPQLWNPAELLQSSYQPGTIITDEFLVLRKSNDSILIRGGDKVSKAELRPMDGLIELSVRLEPEEGHVEFGFKSLFFQGLGKSDRPPMPGFVVWLHEQYAKALLESGVRHVLRD